MSDTPKERLRLALLVDSDNVSAYSAAEIVSKAAEHGVLSVRRVFGDFSTGESAPWMSPAIQALGLQPVHVERRQAGDKSTDAALLAEAEALSRTAAVDGVCVASSDGDFACLAEPLRRAKQLFLVAAPMLASRKLVDSCDVFIALDGGLVPPKPSSLSCRELMLLTDAVEMHTNKAGWAKLSAVSAYLECHSPAFDKNKWGHRSLRELLLSLGCFEVARYQGGAVRTRRKRLPRAKTTGLRQVGDDDSGQRLSELGSAAE